MQGIDINTAIKCYKLKVLRMHIQILRVTTRNTKIFNSEIIVGGEREERGRQENLIKAKK